MSNYDEKKECLDEEAIVYENPRYEKALVGVECRTGRAIYDFDRMVECLVDEGMTEIDAVEWIDYNVIGLGGDGLFPVVMERFDDLAAEKDI